MFNLLKKMFNRKWYEFIHLRNNPSIFINGVEFTVCTINNGLKLVCGTIKVLEMLFEK